MKNLKHMQAIVAITLLAVLLAACGGDSGSTGSVGNGSSSTTTTNTPATASGSGNTANPPAASDNGAAGSYTSFEVSSTNVYTSRLGFYYYIGIVKNTGSETAKTIQVLLVDDSGKLIESSEAPEATLVQAILPPGKQAGFEIQTEKQISKPGFKVTSRTIPANDPLPPAQLSIVNDKLEPGDKGNAMKVSGEIKNDSDKPAILTAVNAVGYDDSGKLVEVSMSRGILSGEGGVVPANGTAKFELDFASGVYDNMATKVTKYELFVSGYQNTIPPQ